MPDSGSHQRPNTASKSVHSDDSRVGDSPPSTRSRANITTACLTCRQRKRKCMGGQPCPPCASSNSPCYYEEGLDRRRKVYNEKARAEVEFQRRLLDGLLRAIKSEECDRILNMVRNDASMEELAAELNSMGNRNECSNGRSFATQPEQSIPRHPALPAPYVQQPSPTQPMPRPNPANFREPNRPSRGSSAGILPPFAELSASIPESSWNELPRRSSNVASELPNRSLNG